MKRKIISSLIAISPTIPIGDLLLQIEGWSLAFIATMVWVFVICEKYIYDGWFGNSIKDEIKNQ